MKKILFIIGKTRSGKDTIAKKLKEMYGVEPIVSYTTRPKRDNETNGVEHWFISKDEMEQIKSRGNMIAYTINEKTGVEYCATSFDLDPNKWYSYIINPEGLRYFIANMGDDIFTRTIFVDCSESILRFRGSERNEDDSVFLKRIESEREEFDYFRDEWSSVIDGVVHTDSFPISEYNNIANRIYTNMSKAVLTYKTTYVKKVILVPEYSEGCEVYLKNLNGTKICKKVTIKKVITDGKRFNEPLYVLYEYPNTVVRERDLDNKLRGITEIVNYVLSLLISKIGGDDRHGAFNS